MLKFDYFRNPTSSVTKLLPIKWDPVTDASNLNYLNIGENLRMDKTLSLVDRLSHLNLQDMNS